MAVLTARSSKTFAAFFCGYRLKKSAQNFASRYCRHSPSTTLRVEKITAQLEPIFCHTRTTILEFPRVKILFLKAYYTQGHSEM
ncbi:hypothetical protein [Campylobacter magnus]|uniref:hypothetical protein n=1 Tax=Campylobacter magnus TaxID=3026462 RepID=UPI00235FA3E2|nr:hypothetical protein [Campylobacter magnus]MDD0854971.1 hypothetical protein [Campylobacter magnus]